MYTRNQAHEMCMQAIYSALIRDSLNIEFDVEEEMSFVFDLPFEEIDTFSKSIVIKTLLNMDKAIPVLSKELNLWSWDRITYISKAILLTSYAHYYFVEKVDKAIVINIAIKLSKKYLDAKDFTFINAVLEKVLL